MFSWKTKVTAPVLALVAATTVGVGAAHADYPVSGAIGFAYTNSGGPDRWGASITPELSDRANGRFQKFQNATSFYWNAQVDNGNAHQIGGAIRDKWGSYGWEIGVLKYPVTNELSSGKGGRFNRFQNGSIYWSANTGAQVVQKGKIADRWAEKGWENGALGFPVTDVISLPPTSDNSTAGKFQRFQGGHIYETKFGAFVIWGAIFDKWASQGYERGALGYPITDESWTNGHFTQKFEHGEISWP